MGLGVLNLFSHTENATAYRQLTLLGSTSIALSLASGWTTWDGMSNFTDNPVLSFLITFGIQGVMLIAAWLIGETFVRDKRGLARGRQSGRRVPIVLGFALAGLAAFSAYTLVTSPPQFVTRWREQVADWPWGTLALVALAVVLGVVLLIRLRGRPDDLDDERSYTNPLLAALRHIPLWVMFLTCLAASVFFSFDSLFDTIYSTEDRKRSSHTRVESEVAMLLTGLANEVEQQRQAAVVGIFSSPQWAAYERGIAGLISAASEAKTTALARQEDQDRRNKNEVAAQRALISAAETRLGSLDAGIVRVREELSATSPGVEAAEAVVRERTKELATRRSELRFKAAEAQAELAGVGVTQLAGEGPKFREIKQEQTKLQISVSLLEKLLDDAKGELARQIEARRALLAQAEQLEGQTNIIKSEIAAAKGSLAALSSSADRDSTALEKSAEHVDALNEAKVAFVSAPTDEGFRELQRRCEALLATLTSVATSVHAAGAACPADALSELTAKVFAANASASFFQRECGKETKLGGLATDELLQLGQKCLQASGLQSTTTAALQSELRQTSLRLDDRAHRFIVTWNAFFDRNPLAFVALFIAVAMDGLIFMSGLFGARARAEMTTALDESASRDGRNSEIMLDTALQPEPQVRARLVLEAIDFTNGQADVVGYVDVTKVAPSRAGTLRVILNAATVLGLARPAGADGRFAITQKLIERLAERLGCMRGLGSGLVAEIDAEELLRVSAGRGAREIVRLLLQLARPLPPGSDFTHHIELNRLPQDIRDQLISVLNAGVAGACVSTDPETPGRYLLNADFFSMITRIVAAEEQRVLGVTVVPSTRHARLLTAPHVEIEPMDETFSNDEAETVGPLDTETDVFQRQGPERLKPRPSAPPAMPVVNGGQHDAGPHPVAAASEATAPAERIETPPASLDRPMPRPANDVAAPPPSSANGAEDEVEFRPASTLVAFPADLAVRRGTLQDGRAPQRAEALAGGNALLPKNVLAGLGRATGLGKAELIYLVDPQSGPAFESACNALKALCASDETLNRRLRHLEHALWSKIQSSLPSRTVVSMHADTAARLIANSFPRILLCSCGLREARAWCDNLVMERELLAAAGGIAKKDGHTLGQIVQQLPALMAVDDEHRSSWKELICRIDRLRVMPDFGKALGEIMP